MEKLKFSPISLAERASTSFVASLWGKEDIIKNIQDVFLRTSERIDKVWPDVEQNVLLHLSKYILPERINSNLKNLINVMGYEILKWILLTRTMFASFSYIPESILFYWTERGTLDDIRTTQFIIDSAPDKCLRFCLACIFSMENVISGLWPEVRPALYEKINRDLVILQPITVIYWVYYLNNDVENLRTLMEHYRVTDPHEFAFLATIDTQCLSTISYFLGRIKPEKKRSLVLMALNTIFRAKKPFDGNVLIFLFGYLEESKVNALISENPYCVLASLLEWPSLEFFMSIADLSWNRLSDSDYLNLFQDLVFCVSNCTLGNIYKNLVKDFWQSSPSSFKEYTISKCTSGTFLSRLFLSDNTDEIIMMILRDCSPKERRQMIFYFEGMNICDLLVKREKWSSLKLFITNCISSCDILEEFITVYETSKPCYSDDETSLRTDILVKKIREWF